MTRFQIFHEIGHALIGLIFEDYVMRVEKIILNKKDIKQLNLNVNDAAYTHQKNVVVDQKLIDDNECLYAMINGLNFLGGIAGATFLSPINKPKTNQVTAKNFNDILNIQGSSGDFEFINGGQVLYSWYLFTKNKLNINDAYEHHAYLMNLLQELFLDDRLRDISKKIHKLIVDKPDTNIEHDKLVDFFPKNLQTEFRNKLIQKLEKDNNCA